MDLTAGQTPHHLGFVVPDAAAARELLVASLGCVRHRTFQLDLADEHFTTGVPGSIKIVLAELGGLLYEFIEPVGDAPTVWRQALEQRQPGLHHVAYTEIPGYDSVIGRLQDDGFEVSVAGSFPTVVVDDAGRVVHNHWCYVERSGLVFELTSGEGPSVDG